MPSIRLSRPRVTDLGAINSLMQLYGKMSISKEHLNNRDLSIQARNDAGEVVGFVWAGLMAGNTIAYVDLFTVHPEYTKQGIGISMLKELFKLGVRRGVKQARGILRQDKYHDKAAMNALKMACGADSEAYTYIYGDTMNMAKEFEVLMKEAS